MKAKMQQILSFIRRNKLATKVISFTLSLVLVFYVIPSSIYAEAAELLSSVESGSENTENTENTNTEDSAPGNNLEINNESDYTVPLYEAEELREESVKHFKLSDGSYMAAQYPSAVHYADENGIWQDIDNSLSESGAEYSNSNARIKFAKKITGNSSLFTLHDSGTKITLSLTGAIKGTTGAVTNNSDAESDTELQKMLNLENLSSSIIYRDILDGIDLEYIATSMNVKENIIVKESKDSYSYSFELKLNGLGATLSESGDILITVEGTDEIKYVIPAPVVYDSSGTHAPEDKAYYTLTHENGKKYTLTITADSEWMNSDERAFPITIDPAIVSARSSIVDTYISLDSPETYNHLATSLYVSDREYTYVKCEELPTISPNAYISNATVTMRSSNAPHAVYVGAYAVITDWDTSLSWNTHTDSTSPAGQIDERVIDYAIVSGYDFFSWNITSLARKWYAENNYGVAFKSLLDDNNSVSFFSENFTVNSTYCPTVTITYRDMKGIEDYWSYSSHSAGVAGNGYVNLATGNLVLDIPTLTTTDGLFRYTPTLYYNSSLRNEEYIYGPTKSAYTTSYAPIGFKLNICETIVEEVYSNSDVTNESYFIHVDEDGTEHAYYAETDTENDEKYYDEDGLGKTMTVSDTTIEITDSSHIIKRFFKMSSTPSTNVYSAWFLSEIEDAAGNKLIFTFDSSYRPTKINLRPNGATSNTPLMTLLYTLDGKLCIYITPQLAIATGDTPYIYVFPSI